MYLGDLRPGAPAHLGWVHGTPLAGCHGVLLIAAPTHAGACWATREGPWAGVQVLGGEVAGATLCLLAAQATRMVILGPEVMEVTPGSSLELSVQLQQDNGEVAKGKPLQDSSQTFQRPTGVRILEGCRQGATRVSWHPGCSAATWFALTPPHCQSRGGRATPVMSMSCAWPCVRVAPTARCRGCVSSALRVSA